MPLIPNQGNDKKTSAGAIIAAAVVVLAIAGGVLWVRRAKSAAPPPVATAEPIDAGVAVPPPPPSPQEQLAKAGLKHLSIHINGPFETAVIGAVGKEVGAPLTQVLTRSLVWWVRVPADLVKGDALDALYEERANEEPVVHAVRFVSRKHEKTFAAYRFKAEGDPFARFYTPSGEELELRLEDAPIDNYEQVTSRLNDGRRHKGIDFKTAVGTPVKATFDGTVTRKNWSFRGNGNCLELAESGGKGRKVMFLHLSELAKDLQPGRKVKKGEVVAASGNTGHSFAPHLHYQLMTAADQVIDPFENQRTYHRAVAPAQKAALDAEVRRLDALMAPFP